MEERNIRVELQQMLRGLGFDDYHPPDMRQTELGRPDIFFLNSVGPTIIVEVKTIQPKARIDPYLELEKISNAQRKWLDWATYDRGYPCFLGIGTLWKPRRVFLLPWVEWVSVEHSLNGNNRITLSQITEHFGDYELTRVTGGWVLPSGHPIHGIPRKRRETTEWTQPVSLRL